MLVSNSMKLHEKSCEPCRGGIPALAEAEWESLLAEVEGWEVLQGHHLEKKWNCVDFAEALAMTNLAGAVCEEQGHHADFELGWGRFSARIWTHKVDGLTEADFILAAKLNLALCGTE